MYTFLFDRKSLTLLAAGTAVASVLLFVAGVLVGMRIDLTAAAPATAEFRPLSAFEGGLIKSASADPPPALEASAPSLSELATPPPLATSSTSRLEPARPEPAQSEPALPVQAKAEPLRPATPEPTAAAAHALPSASTPSTVQGGGAAEPAVTHAAHAGYSVQVGAYGVPANAAQRLSRVLAAGLDGFIAPLRTPTGGELEAVRFGDYPTLEAAVAAAESYRARYGREALVRPPA